jgi:hypothetical protein
VGVYPESLNACPVSASSGSPIIAANMNSSGRVGRKRNR